MLSSHVHKNLRTAERESADNTNTRVAKTPTKTGNGKRLLETFVIKDFCFY